MASTRAHINPEMLEWARQRVNYDPKRLAKRANTSLKIYNKWAEGTKRPTIKQLQKVAKALRRPIGHFYLNEPPDEPQPRLEMRRVFGSNPMKDTADFSLEVQECVRRREIALELFERLNEVPPELPDPYSLNSDPEEIGEFIRFTVLGVSIKEQVKWSGKYEALRGWRTALEQAGVLCFQMSGISEREARGFAIAKHPLPIAAFNSNDSVRGRIFTLLHEFAHILLGTSTLHSRPPLESDDQTEFWCNHVAASILIPNSDLLSHQMVRERGKGAFWTDYEVQGLARRYNVSAAAMVRRLDAYGLIANSTFEALKEQYDSYERQGKKGNDGSGGNWYNNQIAKLGTLLPSLAFRSFYSNAISARDLSSVMGTGVQNLGTFEEKVMGTKYAFAGE